MTPDASAMSQGPYGVAQTRGSGQGNFAREAALQACGFAVSRLVATALKGLRSMEREGPAHPTKRKTPDLGGKVGRLGAWRACAGRESGAAVDIFG